MKGIILKAVSVLNKHEQGTLFRLILLHSLASIADIGALALLLALIHFYSQAAPVNSGFGLVLRNLQELHFLLPLFLFLLLFIFKNLASFYAASSQFGFIYRVASRISRNNMFQYLNGGYHDYAQINTSVHISRISYQPMEFCTYILAGMQQMSTEIILTSVTIIAILLFNAKLFLLLFVILVPPLALATYFSRKRLNAARSHVKESAEKSTQHLHEALASYIESNVYDRKPFFTKRFENSQRRLSATLSQLQITQAIPSRIIEVFAVFGLLVLIVVNKYSGHASMELVNIGAFMAAAYKIIPGITRMANISAQMRMYQHTIETVRDANAEAANTDTADAGKRIHSISFADVSFSFHNRKVLDHLHLELKSGDFAGISSPSGRGKTTMLNLLLGFYEPDEGRICINGAVLPAAERRAYWSDVAYVKQQAFLIHDSIQKNITLDDEFYDPERLQQAVQLAGLEEFVSSFPEGLGKLVSDNGKNISGGQRQRIALARAFYKDAGLLILDEPFSELDAATEHTILGHLQVMAHAGKMILLITHNKKSLQFCNKTVSING